MDDLKKAARSGAYWTAAAQAGAGACQFAQLFWLARLLPAEDFGLMAIAQAAVGFLAPMTDLGLAQAVVQQKELDRRQLDTLFWLNLMVGAAMFAAFLAAGWGAARFYGQPGLRPLMAGVAVIFLLYPLAAQPTAMLTRSLDFRSLAVADVVSWLFSLVLAVVLAKRGWGAFALGAAHVGRYAVATALSWWLARPGCPWPRLQFDWQKTRPLARLGLWDSGGRWLNILQLNIDRFVLGRWLGMAELGLYSLAWAVVQAPITRLFPVVGKVAGPLFSKIQHRDAGRLSAGYGRVMGLTLALGLPVFLGLSLAAGEVVEVFFGKKWAAAAPVLAILSGVGLVRSLGSPGASLLLARGRPEPNFWWNLFFAAATVAATLGWMLFDPTATGAAWAQLACIGATGWAWHWAIRRFGQAAYRGILKKTAAMCLWSLPFAVAVFFVGKLGLPVWVALLSKAVLMAALGLLFLKKGGFWGMVFSKRR